MNDQERFDRFIKTPTLDQMGVDLTAQARQGTVAPISDYDKDLMRLIQVLCRHKDARTGFRKNNAVLISEPELGMRKIAILEGLVQQMSAPRVPAVASVVEAQEPSWLSFCQEHLQGKRLVTLDVGLLVAGTTSPSEVKERFKEILEEIRSSQDCIIFIDQLHTLLGAEAAWDRVDLAPLLVPAFARGELQCVGATTLDEYRQYIERDQALQRRFQEVIVHESASGAEHRRVRP
jgi:ATP-dependent Clp protease ATP-binding subunit ClpC